MKYKELKSELKQLAKEIRERRYKTRQYQREHGGCHPWRIEEIKEYGYGNRQWEYRHKHIAYCLLRGRKYEEIEKPSEGNEPDMDYIARIMHEYQQKEIA